MDELQEAMDDLMLSNPEMTFFEVSAELAKKGELNAEALQDPGVHVYVFQMFQRSKQRAQSGRMNQDI